VQPGRLAAPLPPRRETAIKRNLAMLLLLLPALLVFLVSVVLVLHLIFSIMAAD
jgi:hypothetical protein